jgi:hypothetical protein
MTGPLFCRIRVKGHLSPQWADWFSDFDIQNRADGLAELSGCLPDQAALYGVLNQMRDLGLALVSLDCVDRDSDSPAFSKQFVSPAEKG